MDINFGSLFHGKSKDKRMRGLVQIPFDNSEWPDSWKTVEFKKYGENFTTVPLPHPNFNESFSSMVSNRTSVRTWRTTPVSLQDISNILYYSCGTVDKGLNPNASRRAQASAGKRYPIEAYVVNHIPGDLERNIYHYLPEEHSLENLWSLDSLTHTKAEELFTYPWTSDAALIVVLTAVVDRSIRKYGERGYRYIYLEAGGIAQSIHLIASTCGLGSVILGGTNDEVIEHALDIDGLIETLICAVAIGNRTVT